MRDLIGFLRDYRRYYALLLGVLVGTAALEGLAIAALYPLLTVVLGAADAAAGPVLGALADFVAAFPAEQRLTAALALFLLIVLANALAKLLREWSQAWLSGYATYDVKRRAFECLRTAPYPYFLERKQGDLTYRVSVAPANLASALLLVAMTTSYVLTSVATTLLLLSIEWRVTLAMLVLGVVFFRANRYVAQRFSSKAGREKIAAQAAELGVAQEFVSGAKDIAVAGAGPAWAQRFLLQSARYRRFYVRDLTWAAIPALFLELMVLILAGIVVVLLRLAAPDAILSLLPVVAIYAYAGRQLLSYVGVLSRQLLRLAALAPDVALLRHAVTEALPQPIEGPRRDVESWRRILLREVSFTYPGRSEPVLRDVSFAIERGRTTALVGASGVGKTTLLYLLLRLFEFTRGDIALDGVSIRDFRRADWLARLGYVGQEHFVFGGSVADNIAFGSERSLESIQAAARAAYADEFIRALPEGYATVVGDRGMTLSAGQRQRLVIARALVREPTLLLLDEATSALDSVSEQLVQRALADIAGARTVVVVAHRLSTVQRADQLVVLEHGRVVERGRHHELLDAGGAYARLVRALEVGKSAAAV